MRVLILLLVLVLVVLVTGENKVNSYFNQLKLSWVCKSEWSLTITTFPGGGGGWVVGKCVTKENPKSDLDLD